MTPPKPGPTGEFPYGKPTTEGDRGGLYAALSIEGRMLRLDFATSLTFVKMSKQEAVAFALAIMDKAGQLPD